MQFIIIEFFNDVHAIINILASFDESSSKYIYSVDFAKFLGNDMRLLKRRDYPHGKQEAVQALARSTMTSLSSRIPYT